MFPDQKAEVRCLGTIGKVGWMNESSDSASRVLERQVLEQMSDISAEAQRRGRGLVDDPYPAWAEAQRQAAVHSGSAVDFFGLSRDEHFIHSRPHVTLLSFDACDEALNNNLVFSSEIWDEHRSSLRFGRSILNMVGTEHQQYRKVVQPAFTRTKVESWWRPAWIDQVVAELIDELAGQDTVDLNSTLCVKLPMHVITRAFGLDDAKAAEFRQQLLINMNPSLDAALLDAAEAHINATLQAEIVARRDDPRDDLISVMLHGELKTEDGAEARLPEELIYGFCRVILTAGGGTTSRQLGITLVGLLSNPEQFEAVKADRSLIERAIMESLRWNPTLPFMYRLVTEDVRVQGFDIPAGSIANICMGAANRDPARWDDPHRFDLFRPMKRHLGFMGGPHTCLGMFVAIAEMRVAINALLDAFPKLRFDPDSAPARIVGSPDLRGLDHLRVRLDSPGRGRAATGQCRSRQG